MIEIVVDYHLVCTIFKDYHRGSNFATSTRRQGNKFVVKYQSIKLHIPASKTVPFAALCF